MAGKVAREEDPPAHSRLSRSSIQVRMLASDVVAELACRDIQVRKCVEMDSCLLLNNPPVFLIYVLEVPTEVSSDLARLLHSYSRPKVGVRFRISLGSAKAEGRRSRGGAVSSAGTTGRDASARSAVVRSSVSIMSTDTIARSVESLGKAISNEP